MNDELCIVTCGKRKIWDKYPDAGPQKAENVYIGPLSKKTKEYAKKFYPNSWLILSAKHGFLKSYDIIDQNYNACFHTKSKTISFDELENQVLNKNLNKYKRIIVLGGKFYTKMIFNLFPNIEVLNPLKDCKGIGYMLKMINDAIQNGNKLE